MRKLLPLLLVLGAACQNTVERAPSTWYAVAEIPCHLASCHHCHGRGDVGCPPCRASGKVPCTQCPANGIVKCTVCKGDGSKDGKKCKSCDGKGQRNCPTCNATKFMKCGHCDGKARLTCLRPLPISETPPRGDDAWPPGNEPGSP